MKLADLHEAKVDDVPWDDREFKVTNMSYEPSRGDIKKGATLHIYDIDYLPLKGKGKLKKLKVGDELEVHQFVDEYEVTLKRVK